MEQDKPSKPKVNAWVSEVTSNELDRWASEDGVVRSDVIRVALWYGMERFVELTREQRRALYGEARLAL